MTKIVLIGAHTTIAESILEQLALHNFNSDQIVLLDHPQNIPSTLEYMGLDKTVTDVDLFDWKKPFIALICNKNILYQYSKKRPPKNSWIIDCTGSIPHAPCIIPEINENKILSNNHHMICAPTSMTVILSHVLTSLFSYKPSHIKVIALAGTSFLGAEAAQILNEQTKGVYQQVNYMQDPTHPPLAFNLIPQIITKEHLVSPSQIQCITGTKIHFRHCFVPVFRGFAIFISCHIKGKFKQNLWNQNPYIHLIEHQKSGFILSSASTISETKFFVTDLKCQKGDLSFWLVGDDIQAGMSYNTIHIINTLLKKFI